MFHIQTEANDHQQTPELPSQDGDDELNIEINIDAELDAITNVQELYQLSGNKFVLCIPPFIDAVGKGITLATDLYTTGTSPALIGIASGAQVLNATGLNVKSVAQNCIATGNMLRYGAFPEEWPALSTCKRISACLIALPPTIAATISDASQAFFLMRMIGAYRYLNKIPGPLRDIGGGALAMATGWTTFFTKGLETGHAASTVLGKAEKHPNRIVQYSIVGFSWLCGGGALIHDTAITFNAMTSFCDWLSVPLDDAKAPLLAVSLCNGVATACYQQAFVTSAMQKSSRALAENTVTRKTGFMLTLSLGLSLFILLERPSNKLAYAAMGNSFNITADDEWNELIAYYVFTTMYLVSVAALYEPVSQTTTWCATKANGMFQCIGNIGEQISNLFWQTLISPPQAHQSDASLPLLANDDAEDNNTSIQTNSPLIAHSVFRLKTEKPQKTANIMRCGLF